MNRNTSYFQNVEDCVEAILGRVGNTVVLGASLGLARPNHLLNAFYRRAKADPGIKLTIVTGLSLAKPKGSSDLEKRFLGPFVDRIFGNYPDLDYVEPYAKNRLPDNIQVVEFFLQAGAFLNDPAAQQNYMNSNYTHAFRDMITQGVNVIAQNIAKATIDGSTYYSLSSNTDALNGIARLREQEKRGQRIAVVGQVNRQMPFMYNDAMVAPDTFDMVLDNRDYDYTLFGPPNMPLDTTDYMIGLNASALIKDGGTLQIGIGSLGDAITYGCCLRHEDNKQYRAVLSALGVGTHYAETIAQIGGTQPFDQGLYGSSEMFCDGFRHLYDRGILKREVYDDIGIQRLLNEGVIDGAIRPDILRRLLEQKIIGPRLSAQDFAYLQRFGILRETLRYEGGCIRTEDDSLLSTNLGDDKNLVAIQKRCLGSRLQGGVVMHGGFFLGPQAMYQALRDMDEAERRKFSMTDIAYVNELYGHQELATLQRRDARFINTTILMTLLGSACSDGLDNGQMISGVGGQYNFVAMAHALAGARSILMLRSTRSKGDQVSSNIVWNYGHTTIPRHLRDIVVTEYGIADLRGRRDKTIIAALLNITDSRFQEKLLETAKQFGKIPADYRIPERFRNNTPERLEQTLAEFRNSGLFPAFPFGTDFTNEELVLGKVLKSLKNKLGSKTGLFKTLMGAIDTPSVPDAAIPYLARLRLDQPQTLRETMIRKLIVSELIGGGYV